jgi:hypothetical protein
MSTGVVVRNAGSHRILEALCARERSSKELKNIAGAINSILRFEGEYMNRLVNNGLVEQVGAGWWRITPDGLQKLTELGPSTVDSSSLNVAGPRENSWKEQPPYEPKAELYTYVRRGSEDALRLPSRIGNKLHYRDGRVEEI